MIYLYDLDIDDIGTDDIDINGIGTDTQKFSFKFFL